VKSAVDWLGRNQAPDGTWRGNRGNTTGVVAACAIALMSQGHLPGIGEYGPQTAKALEFLMRNAQPDGLLYRADMGPFPMYHHGLATLALAEAWGQSANPRMREVLRKAVDLICSCQNRQGGWRYQPVVNDADLSVTVMQLMALRAARDAGLDVPGEVIDLGIGYVKSCQNAKGKGKDGGFAYQPNGESGFARTGAGITSLQVAGDYRAGEVSEGIEYLMSFKPVGEKKPDHEEFYFYGLYYATMGMYQAQSLGSAGRRWWSQWYPPVVKDVLSRIGPDGKIKSGNDVYDTAMAVLILTIPYRYLPIYQR
jgi:prenyltransferase beta subunit